MQYENVPKCFFLKAKEEKENTVQTRKNVNYTVGKILQTIIKIIWVSEPYYVEMRFDITNIATKICSHIFSCRNLKRWLQTILN